MSYFSFFSTLYLFLPLITQNYGLNKQYVGIIGFIYSFGSILSGFSLANYIENHPKKEIIINTIIIVKLIALAFLVILNNYIFLLTGVFLIGYLGASFVGSNISQSENKGLVLAISSLGFIVGYLIGGIVGDFNKMLIIVAGILLISLLLNIVIKPFEQKQIGKEINTPNSFEIIKKNWYIYLSLVLRHTGAAGIWIYFTYILLNYYKMDLLVIGILNAVNIFVQTISNPILYRFIQKDDQKVKKVILMGYVLSAIYFLIFPFTKEIYILLALQVILGISFTSLYIGNIEYLTINNREKITAVTLISSSFSFANSLGALISAFLVKLGYIWLFFNGFLLSLVSSLIVFFILTQEKMNGYLRTE
ncbi:MAG: MFS transporter [bacterium]